MICLERPFHGYSNIVGLPLTERSQLDADLLQMQPRYFFVQLLGQNIDIDLVGVLVLPEVELRQRLIGEAVAHHEAGVAGCAAEVD